MTTTTLPVGSTTFVRGETYGVLGWTADRWTTTDARCRAPAAGAGPGPYGFLRAGEDEASRAPRRPRVTPVATGVRQLR
jgi:hypothetical protein